MLLFLSGHILFAMLETTRVSFPLWYIPSYIEIKDTFWIILMKRIYLYLYPRYPDHLLYIYASFQYPLYRWSFWQKKSYQYNNGIEIEHLTLSFTISSNFRIRILRYQICHFIFKFSCLFVRMTFNLFNFKALFQSFYRNDNLYLFPEWHQKFQLYFKTFIS